MSTDSDYSLREEILSSSIHGLGAILGIAGLSMLLVLSIYFGTVTAFFSYLIYGITFILLFTTSTLYHSLPHPKAKRFFKICDHACIYLLIAGTYTPFLMLHLTGTLRLTLMSIIWGLALLGIIFKFFYTGRFRVLSTCLYILMGWLVIFATKPLSVTLDSRAFDWLFIGGGFYTFGTIFYMLKKIPYTHALWHLFVLLGSLAHFTAVVYGAGFPPIR